MNTRTSPLLSRRPLTRGHLPGLAVVTAALLATPTLDAQRDEVDLGWQKRKVVVAYGAVPVGKHGLHELPVGGTWRMGQNLASTFETELPLLSGDDLLAPGSYRVNIHRAGDQDLRLNFDGAGGALGAGKAVQFAGKLVESEDPGKKLCLTWVHGKGKKKKRRPTGKQVCETSLCLEFGKHEVHFPIQVVGADTHRVRGFTAASFTWPSELLEKRVAAKKATPILSLSRKGKPKKGEAAGYNLLISKETARIVPHMEAPTASFGFGPPVPPAADEDASGTVTWSKAQSKAKHLKATTVKLAKDVLTVEFQVGEQQGKVELPLPKAGVEK